MAAAANAGHHAVVGWSTDGKLEPLRVVLTRTVMLTLSQGHVTFTLSESYGLGCLLQHTGSLNLTEAQALATRTQCRSPSGFRVSTARVIRDSDEPVTLRALLRPPPPRRPRPPLGLGLPAHAQ